MAKTLEEIEKSLRGACFADKEYVPVHILSILMELLDYLIEKDKYPEGKLTDK
jgi:hypothetical protein